MRILYHHRTLGDGAEGIHIAEMVAAFRSLGHEVHVRGLAAERTSSGRRDLVARVKRAIPYAAFEAVSAGSNIPEYFDVRRTIARLRPDFVYKRHARLDIGAIAAARRAGVRTVLEVNALFTGASYRHYEPIAFEGTAARVERRALVDADIVLAVSTPLAASIRQMSGVQAMVMPNGADPDRFDPAHVDGDAVRARLGIGDAFTVGWVGIMREWHGLELLLDAVATMPGTRLLLVGDGPAREATEGYADAKGMRDRVVVTGRVPPEQMPAHIAAMEVAVVASDRTGVASPMKLLEYMAMARPVVAPRLANIQDLITDGQDGLLFTPESGADLARQLHRVHGNTALREELGRRARETVVRQRTWRANAEQVIQLVHLRAGSPVSSPDVALRPAATHHSQRTR